MEQETKTSQSANNALNETLIVINAKGDAGEIHHVLEDTAKRRKKGKQQVNTRM